MLDNNKSYIHKPKHVVVNPLSIEECFKKMICGECKASPQECQNETFRYTIGQGSKLSSGCLAYVRNNNVPDKA